jgi:hypothetical protein
MIWYCPVSSRSFSLRKPNSALSLSEAESVSVWVTVVPLQPSDTCTLAAS